MGKKKLTLLIFILAALAQLYVPTKMIHDQEDILTTGKEYKFKTEPIDPSDPFRGKYITLQYKETTLRVQNTNDWVRGETIYVLLSIDKNGFAGIHSVSKIKPPGNEDFVKAKVEYVSNFQDKELTINYPFTRYYMEESKAQEAESNYNRSVRDTNQIAYGLVNIKDGEAVLKDVLINGVSIKKIVNAPSKK